MLVKFIDCYADEFDVFGFSTMKKTAWEKYVSRFEKMVNENKISFPLKLFFGTNEYLEYHNLNQYFDVFTVTPISQGEYNILSDLFNSKTKIPKDVIYGIFNTVIINHDEIEENN